MALTVLVLTSLAARAKADDRHSDAWRQASKIHQEAERALRSGNRNEACRLYGESEALDASAATQTRVAECLEHDGHLARALEAYEAALALVDRLEPDRGRRIAELISRRIAGLEPRVPKLRIGAAHEIDGLAIALDGRMLSREELGTTLRVDPGTHVITATAPTFAPARCELEGTEGMNREAAVVTGEGDTCRLEDGRWIVTLRKTGADQTAIAPISTERPAPASPKRTSPPKTHSMTPDLERADSDRTERMLGWAVGGAGVVALGVGAYFGIRTLVLVGDADCDAQNRCSQSGVETIHSASGTQTAGFVATAVGAALLSGGIALEVLSAKRSSAARGARRSVVAHVTMAGASIGGTW